MYTTRVPRTRELRPRHSVQNQWDLLEPLGIPRPTPDSHRRNSPPSRAPRARSTRGWVTPASIPVIAW
jgi:hypothetical protein